jgi:hypothetical protein
MHIIMRLRYYTHITHTILKTIYGILPTETGHEEIGYFSKKNSIFVRRSKGTNFYGSRTETIQLNCVHRKVLYMNSFYMYILGVCTICMVKFN